MIIKLEENEQGNAVLPLGDELCAKLGWHEGDTIKWIDNNDGSYTLKKKETELVMVETILTYRIRYVVEVPKGKSEWARDTVTMDEADEFSQLCLGETITSHRVIDEDEFVQMFDEDNDYLKEWETDKKFRCVKRLEEIEESDDIDHSVHWYDEERNK
jgi:hypothetical protein